MALFDKCTNVWKRSVNSEALLAVSGDLRCVCVPHCAPAIVYRWHHCGLRHPRYKDSCGGEDKAVRHLNGAARSRTQDLQRRSLWGTAAVRGHIKVQFSWNSKAIFTQQNPWLAAQILEGLGLHV